MVGWFMLSMEDEEGLMISARQKRVQFGVVAFFDVRFGFGLADGRATWTDGRTSWRNNDRTGASVWTLLWGRCTGPLKLHQHWAQEIFT